MSRKSTISAPKRLPTSTPNTYQRPHRAQPRRRARGCCPGFEVQDRRWYCRGLRRAFAGNTSVCLGYGPFFWNFCSNQACRPPHAAANNSGSWMPHRFVPMCPRTMVDLSLCLPPPRRPRWDICWLTRSGLCKPWCTCTSFQKV